MKPATLLIAVSISLLLPFKSARSEEAATILVERAALNREVIEYVARTGKPRSISVGHGETVAGLIAAHCGRIDEFYVELLRRDSFAGIPKGFDLNTPLTVPATIELPACLHLPQYTLNVTPNYYFISPSPITLDPLRLMCSGTNSPEDMWWCSDSMTLSNRVTINATDWRSSTEYVPDTDWWSTQHLQMVRFGSTYASMRPEVRWSSLVVRSDLSISAKQAAEHLTALLVAGGQDPRTAIADDPEEIQLYSNLTDSELSTQQACQPQPGEVAEPNSDLLQLVEVLSYSLQKIKKGSDRVVIVIPDTGLYDDGRSPFSQHLGPGMSALGIYDPYELRPHKGYDKHQHGTYVATLTLGGPAFMPILDSLGLNLEIVPVNIVDEKYEDCIINGKVSSCPRYRVKGDDFNNAIEQSALLTNVIVNLSVGRQKPFAAIQRNLSKDSNVLFVVAAGNDARALSERAVFPARYGGSNDGVYNLITVAAADVNGRRASFSNHGESYVDLAAPGCRRPVLDYNAELDSYQIYMASGTSFAAPSVSFVAALLKATWPGSRPRAIKRRILTSSDILPELQRGGIKDGRLLNAAKALSIYQDVIEAKIDGKKIIIRGQIDENSQNFDFCDGALSLYRKPGTNQSVVKKITATDTPASGFMIYWLNAEGVLNSSVCQKQDFSIKIREDFTNRTYVVETDDIVDIVFSEWGNNPLF